MKLGIFDSGLGGLMVAKAIRDHFSDLDFVYFGDTVHLPYGNRSDELIYAYSRRAVSYLFQEHDCQIIIVACNTASAAALRRLQQEWLPQHYPERRILGVVVPTLEAALEQGIRNLGVIATNYIVQSGVYREELQKLDANMQITHQPTPLLVPLIEHQGEAWLEDVLAQYLEPLQNAEVEGLILGCTHYIALKDLVRDTTDLYVFSQDEIIPQKLEWYLNAHPEHDEKISRTGFSEFYVSDVTDHYVEAAHALYGSDIHIQKANISDE